MSDATAHVKISKFLSYVLRHRPDEIGLALDANGWASVAELIERARAASVELDEPLRLLDHLVSPLLRSIAPPLDLNAVV